MIRVLSTLLSRRPRKNAAIVAAFSVLVLTCGSAIYWSNYLGAHEWMPASREAVLERHEIWRLFTTLFAHADVGHLVANAGLYGILSYLLFGYFGVGIFPLLSWALAIPMTALALTGYRSDTEIIGASGLVHLMGGIWLSLYFCLARNKRLTQRILRSIGVMLGIFFPTSFEDKIAYGVHFTGLSIGIIAGLIYYFANKTQLHAADRSIFEEDDESPIDFNNLDELDELEPPTLAREP